MPRQPLRILYYNWVDCHDTEGRGGGVNVYHHNLVTGFAGDPEVEVVSLCAGVSYDPVARTPRWEQIRYGPTEDRPWRYEIINSGVVAPAHVSFGDREQITHPETVRAVADFLRAKGPFDIIHFHNLEGLPADILDLRSEFPNTRFVFTAHNYYPMCPQVNLWHREMQHCSDFLDGRACAICLPTKTNRDVVVRAHAVAYWLKKRGITQKSRLFDPGFKLGLKLLRRSAKIRAFWRGERYTKTDRPVFEDPTATPKGRLTRLDQGELFAERRATMMAALNRNCDALIGVSDRVSEILRAHGAAPHLVRTMLIGTRQAEKFAETVPKSRLTKDDGTLTLGYLGHMRHDKGFFFLLKALAALPDAVAAKLRLVIAAPRGNHENLAHLYELATRFASAHYSNGYTHANLDTILSDVDVGVVPVLWEDNLPQVAIEMHARHIPLLTSHRGGAKELGNHPPMVFPAGDATTFAKRIDMLLADQLDLDGYWATAQPPISMEAHFAELKDLYRSLTAPAAEVADTA